MKSNPTNPELPERGSPATRSLPDGGEALPERLGFSIEYRGPLPPPGAFEAYERTLPGAADRILTMVEEEQRHRVAWEKRTFETARGDERRLLYMGAVLALLCLGGAVYLAANGNQVVACIMAGVTALGFVGTAWVRRPVGGEPGLPSERDLLHIRNRSGPS